MIDAPGGSTQVTENMELPKSPVAPKSIGNQDSSP
jgi:hypothetical protein